LFNDQYEIFKKKLLKDDNKRIDLIKDIWESFLSQCGQKTFFRLGIGAIYYAKTAGKLELGAL